MRLLASLALRSQVVLGASCASFACTAGPTDPGDARLLRQMPAEAGNRALFFDGVDDYATTGTAKFPVGRGAQTISAWFEVDDLSGKHALITLRKDGDSGVEFALQDGRVGVFRVYGNRTLAIASEPVTTFTWHHAAYTFDGTTNQVYVDGVLVGSSTNVPDSRTPTTSWLGTLDGARDLFQGKIDRFRVFNVARSSAELAAEAGGTASSTDLGLVLDLPSNEASGNVLFDHSDAANDGELGDGIEERAPSRVASGAPPE